MIDNYKAKKIIDELERMYPNAKAELDYKNNFELLIAVVLSAQTTDIAVNKVTKKLFMDYPDPYSLANANLFDVMEIINSIGLYKTKSKNIISLSNDLVVKFNSVVPNNRSDLESLAGVGRKTANVVLSNAFNVPAIAVDTHVNRVSKRLGIANEDDSLIVIENKIMETFPKETWSKLHHQLIFFGRYHCKAKKPECKSCPLVDICVYSNKNI